MPERLPEGAGASAGSPAMALATAGGPVLPGVAAPATWERIRPTANTIIAIFAVFVLFKSLLPATKTPVVRIPGAYYVDLQLLMLFVWAALAVCVRALRIFSVRMDASTKRYILLPLLALALFQLLSVPFNGQDREEKFYAALECGELLAGVLIPVLFVSGLPYVHRIRVGVGVVLVVTFVTLIYMGLSFVFPQFRPSHAYTHRLDVALGFIRVFGPLGNAASLAIILYPALGFAAGMLFLPGRSKAFWGVIVLIMFAAVVGTGSRGAVLCLPVFGFVVLLTLRLKKALQFLLPIGLLLVSVVVVVGLPERFRQLEDPARRATYQTSWRAFTSSPVSILAGVGHGRLYAPLFANTRRRVYHMDRWYLMYRKTDFGPVLHGAHSTFIKALSESGLLGLVLLGIPLAWVVWNAFNLRARALRDPYTLQARFILAGCVTSMALMIVNTFFFAQPWLAVVWLALALVGTETISQVNRQLRASWRP